MLQWTMCERENKFRFIFTPVYWGEKIIFKSIFTPVYWGEKRNLNLFFPTTIEKEANIFQAMTGCLAHFSIGTALSNRA